MPLGEVDHKEEKCQGGGEFERAQEKGNDIGADGRTAGMGHKAGETRGRGQQRPQPPRWRRAVGPGREKQALRQKQQGEKTHKSEEHTSELQSLMRISYAVFCLKKKNKKLKTNK